MTSLFSRSFVSLLFLSALLLLLVRAHPAEPSTLNPVASDDEANPPLPALSLEALEENNNAHVMEELQEEEDEDLPALMEMEQQAQAHVTSGACSSCRTKLKALTGDAKVSGGPGKEYVYIWHFENNHSELCKVGISTKQTPAERMNQAGGKGKTGRTDAVLVDTWQVKKAKAVEKQFAHDFASHKTSNNYVKSHMDGYTEWYHGGTDAQCKQWLEDSIKAAGGGAGKQWVYTWSFTGHAGDCKMGVSLDQSAAKRAKQQAGPTGQSYKIIHSAQVKKAIAVEQHFKKTHASKRFDQPLQVPMNGFTEWFKC